MTAALLCGTGGCFSEQTIRIHPGDLVRVPAEVPSGSTRQWLARTHGRLRRLLPAGRHSALLTEDLTDASGRATDVFEHFNEIPKTLRTLGGNFRGHLHTAQGIGRSMTINEPAPAWPGFAEVRIPVTDKVRLSGRLGFATVDGGTRHADCIVILPGLFGDNGILRMRDLADALRQHGLHVLAIEMRAHGQTEARHPDVYYTFGTIEAGDLLAVSEWLEAQPNIDRTGLIGACWGANLGLLAAWYDGRPDQHPSISDRVRPFLRPINEHRHFTAGVIGFSPVLRFEELMDDLDTEHALLKNPVLSVFQDTIRSRMKLKSHPEVTGSLRHLIDFEFARSELTYPGAVADSNRFLRFLSYQDKPTGDKLADARIPVLLVHSVNDPLARAQDVANLIARVDNPNVAALILPGGGHVGFAPYARAYYYSLILNFFDPVTGAGASNGTIASTNDHESEKRSLPP